MSQRDVLAFVLSWFLAAAALLLADRIFSGVRLNGDFATALGVAAAFAVLDFLLGWLIFGALAIASLGIGLVFHFVTRLIVAAIVLKLTSSLSSTFSIRGFWPAMGTALLLALAREISTRL